MDETKLSPDRVEVLKRIEQYEREGRFDEDVENDPEASEKVFYDTINLSKEALLMAREKKPVHKGKCK